MNKRDLKLGQVIKLRNGKMYLYTRHNGEHKFVNFRRCVSLKNYGFDLTYKMHDPLYVGTNPDHGKDPMYDVMEIYDVELCDGFDYLFDETYLTLVRKREKTTELTMQEIADKFNITVEQLRIKDN